MKAVAFILKPRCHQHSGGHT